MVDDDAVDSQDEFQQQLQRLLNEATSNGVDIEGGWDVRNDDPALQDWGLEIVALADSDE